MSVVAVSALFEAHLTVTELQRSMVFYQQVLGLELAWHVPERSAAFYWIGGPGKSMLGLWGVGAGPQRMSLHVAFKAELAELLAAPTKLRAADIVPLDFWGVPTDEPVVLAWMPAASLYFRDPDGNSLELLSMLPEDPQPELGIVSWSRWQEVQRDSAGAAGEPA